MELRSANVCGSRVKIFCRTLSWSCSVDSHRCPTLVRIPLLAQTLRNCSLLADKLCSKDRTDTATCSCKHRKSKTVKRQYSHQDVQAANRSTCTAPCGQHARYENDNAAMQPVALLTYNIVMHWSCTAVLAHSVTARTHFEKEQRILRVRLRIQNCLLENMPKPFYYHPFKMNTQCKAPMIDAKSLAQVTWQHFRARSLQVPFAKSSVKDPAQNLLDRFQSCCSRSLCKASFTRCL